MKDKWYFQTLPEIYQALNYSDRGLSNIEAEQRIQSYGSNKLPEAKTDSLAVIFLRQFQSPLIYILLTASVIVFLMDEIIDALVIFVVLFFNAIVGTIQEGRAQNTLLALKKSIETKATVLREQKELIILDSEVVPGDIIILQEGEKVPADARIIEATKLMIDEAAFTGESQPVHKVPNILKKPNLQPAEQRNMVFKGTHVLSGSGKAIVVATGTQTIIGRIFKEIEKIDSEIPLKANIRYLSRLIIITVLGLSVWLFFLPIYQY